MERLLDVEVFAARVEALPLSAASLDTPVVAEAFPWF
jgi:hypothetical protein